MAFDAFLKFEPDVPGEATAKGFEGAIEILSFSFGAANSINPIGGGSGSGKASLSEFNVMKKTDIASATFFQNCCKGKHFDKATVSFRKAGGEQVVYLTYEFEKVFVSSIQWSGSTGGDDVPTESASFAFKKVTITYNSQTDAGEAAGPQVAMYDAAAVA
ncbi:MAG TPA: type VI secretion system tube protein Hcp [Gemmatimonadales bacterium]|nr:type VI secretion system tube protein Hcp [Gemmatimonadales bacterium]